MAFTVRTEPHADYLHIYLEGEYDFEQAIGGVQKMLEECVRHQATKVLIDLRSLAGNMAGMDRFNLAEAFAMRYFEEKKAEIGRASCRERVYVLV